MRDNLERFQIIRPMRRRVPARPKMTIGIGFISKDAEASTSQIFLASDSEMGYGDERKDVTAEKLFTIEFQNARILLVQSGMANPAALAIEKVKALAKGVKIESSACVERVFGNAMRAVRKELIGDLDFSAPNTQDFLFREHGFDFLVGYFIGGKPFLMHIDIFKCTLWPVEKKWFASIGVGNYLADYILKEYFAADENFGCGDQIAVSVIEKVKTNVSGCSGKTQVGWVFPSLIGEGFECNADIFPDGTVDFISRELKLQEHSLNQARNEMMNTFVQNVRTALRSKLGIGSEHKFSIEDGDKTKEFWAKRVI